ncbi:MAG: HNH endonuclease, partial [Candidatus Eisenbacteria sp.]|nr:HNH endonuclease [Candidatus Eisenbacteria bacterium]
NTRFSEVHHIVPRELGGSNHPENLVVLCSTCHKLWHEKKLDGRLLERVLERSQVIGGRATSGAR